MPMSGEKEVERKCAHFKIRQKRSNGIKKISKGLVKYDSRGRMRRHWVKALKKKSRRFLKENCEECGTEKNLTIHHKKQITGGSGIVKGVSSYDELMRLILDEKNCQTLCRGCHDNVHHKNYIVKNKNENK